MKLKTKILQILVRHLTLADGPCIVAMLPCKATVRSAVGQPAPHFLGKEQSSDPFCYGENDAGNVLASAVHILKLERYRED